MNDDDDPVVAYRARDTNDAAMIVQALAEVGIEAVRSGGGAGAAGFGELGADAFLVDILVHEQDAERAKQAILEWQARGIGDPWTCAACGEDNDTGFDVCWKCEGLRA